MANMTALTKSDYDQMRLAEMGAISETLHALSPEQWDHESGCRAWEVRDVIGHMLAGYTTPMGTMVVMVAKSGFSVDKASLTASIEFGRSHTPAELMALYDDVRKNNIKRGISKIIAPKEGMVDHVIHHIDIREPLGLPIEPDPDRLRATLDVAVGLGGFVKAKQRAKDLRLEATDLDWSWGDGPLVRGPAVAILQAISGREIGLQRLEGDGVPTLKSRC